MKSKMVVITVGTVIAATYAYVFYMNKTIQIMNDETRAHLERVKTQFGLD